MTLQTQTGNLHDLANDSAGPRPRPTPYLVPNPTTEPLGAHRDRQLIARLARGDDDALTSLFRHHAPALLGFLRRCLGQQEDAEELLQETFLQAWRQAARYRPAASTPKTWLFTIARSRAIDRIRSRSATRNREERFHLEHTLGRAPEDVHHLAQLAEHRANLLVALDHLPDAQRRCVRLAFVQGLSHRQIALHLDTPLGTAKSRILQGLKRLRCLLVNQDAT